MDKNRPYAQVLAEYVDGAEIASYVYGLDLISQERRGVDSYYLVDGLGSTRGLTDENGNVTDVYNYDAYGNLTDSVGSSENSYRFAGEQFDESLDQYYLRQRYYDPSVGRFTRRDTYEGDNFEPITLHKYIYANANPINNIDPSGLFTLTEVNAATEIANTLNEATLDFGFNVVNRLLGGEGPSFSDFGFDLIFAVLPFLGMVDIPLLRKVNKGSKVDKKLKSTRKTIEYAIEAGKASLERGEPYLKTINGKLKKSEANTLGLEFLGKGFWQNPDNLGEFYSADNLRRYRSPKSKKYSTYTNTGVQANFEVRPNRHTSWDQGINIHIDIEP